MESTSNADINGNKSSPSTAASLQAGALLGSCGAGVEGKGEIWGTPPGCHGTGGHRGDVPERKERLSCFGFKSV